MTELDRSAKVRPETVLTAPRRPIARYRPWVIAALAGALILLVGLGFLVAFGGGQGRRTSETTPPAPEAPAAPPNLDRRLPASYDDPLAIRPVEETDLAPATNDLAAVQASPPPSGAPADNSWIQERQAARASGPFFAGAVSPRGGQADADAALGAFPMPLTAAPAAPRAASGTAKEQFIAGAVGVDTLVPHLPVPALSRFEVKAGAVIPAALVTGLNSDLPGPVVAQVTEPVFDHVTGRHVLIPQGARLIGRYDSQVGHGQDRVLVVWTRIVFPDGRSLNIGAMTGADTTGAGGLADRVDAHIPALARAIGLSSLISVGAAAAQNSLSRGSDNLVLRDGAGGLSAAASQTGQRLVERDLQRQPTIRVRPGWPVRVLVDKDLVLAP